MNTHALSGVKEYATTASTAIATNFGCVRNAAGYNNRHKILIIGVHWKCLPIDDTPQSEVPVGPDKLKVVASSCYLGDMRL